MKKKKKVENHGIMCTEKDYLEVQNSKTVKKILSASNSKANHIVKY